MGSRALRAVFRVRNMFGTQLFASATDLTRSHNLPPSEMKSLYGSIKRSAVTSLLYVTPSMPSLLCMRSPKGDNSVPLGHQPAALASHNGHDHRVMGASRGDGTIG